MVYNEGDKLVHEETGLRCTVLMVNTFQMTVQSDSGRGETWITDREDPEGFREATENDFVDEMGFDFIPQDLGANQVRMLVFDKMFAESNQESPEAKTEQAVALSNTILKEIFKDNG